jgi:hypothetical protein
MLYTHLRRLELVLQSVSESVTERDTIDFENYQIVSECSVNLECVRSHSDEHYILSLFQTLSNNMIVVLQTPSSTKYYRIDTRHENPIHTLLTTIESYFVISEPN